MRELNEHVSFVWDEHHSDTSKIRSYKHFEQCNEVERELIEDKRKELLQINFDKRSKSTIRSADKERINSLYSEYCN